VLNSQPAQYEKNKIDKDNSENKTKKNHKKNHVGKYCNNLKCFKGKKTKKLNSQPTPY
jgi:hypothetical protein